MHYTAKYVTHLHYIKIQVWTIQKQNHNKISEQEIWYSLLEKKKVRKNDIWENIPVLDYFVLA